ncbi:hypothetical protein BKA56DRAFT_602635 [Ilyonectria sp. MPI-CAGE-AT-0026]|nr:hypothetical protein BKA56DRAFT_602635 [Ilyonectria sp. MPI-CAGE-AT-0026]
MAGPIHQTIIFKVGVNKSEFQLDRELVSRHSNDLVRLGPTPANQNPCILLPEIDSDTFEYFRQFLANSTIPRQNSRSLGFKQRSSTEQLRQSKGARDWKELKGVYLGQSLDSKSTSDDDCYPGGPFCHARACVFAQCYGIRNLRLLCLRKLCQSLDDFDARKGAADIAELSRYCRESENKDLNETVTQYVKYKKEELLKRDGLQEQDCKELSERVKE